jgi:hypothetical protein
LLIALEQSMTRFFVWVATKESHEMKRHILTALLALAGIGVGCAQRQPPIVTPQPPPPARTLGATFAGAGTPRVALRIDTGESVSCHFDIAWHAVCPLPDALPAPFGANFTLAADGYVDVDYRFTLGEWAVADGVQHFDATHRAQELPVVLTLAELPPTPPDYDPSTLSMETLEAVGIRGAMWSARMDVPYGPRPGAPDNILALEFYSVFSPADRERMFAKYTGEGFTHGATGPIQGNDCYHNLYPCPHFDHLTQEVWDQYLDQLQDWWNHGVAPIYFAHPDNWSFEQTRDEMTPFLMQPRAQKLIRYLAPFGWEPGIYNISSCTWQAFAKWGRETMPNAIILLHNAVKDDGSPADAFVGADSSCDDEAIGRAHGLQGADIIGSWRGLEPYVHGWLIQSGPKSGPPSAWNFDPGGAAEWAAMFSSGSDGFSYHGIAAHLKGGMAGWPTGSAFGPNHPIWMLSGEQTAYRQFWGDEPEAWANAWGDLAMDHGADGYLDGGTRSVSRVPVPWQVH